MKYNNLLLCLLLLFISVTGFGQAKKFLYYFDKDFNSTDKSTAIFTGIGLYENGALELKLYNAVTNKLVLKEHYKDSSLQVNTGLFQSYYSDASVESEGNYVDGKEEGLWIKKDSMRRTIDSSIYSKGEKTLEVHTGYFKNGSLDSFIVNDIKADRLQKTYYNDKRKMTSEVTFTGQNGIDKVYDDNGKLVINDTVFTRAEVEASFPGGEGAWTKYILKQIVKNADALVRDGKSGTCRIKFIVDKNGNVKNAEAITMQGSMLARIALNAILKGPKWLPAVQYGRPVNAYREQPVTFTVQDN